MWIIITVVLPNGRIFSDIVVACKEMKSSNRWKAGENARYGSGEIRYSAVNVRMAVQANSCTGSERPKLVLKDTGRTASRKYQICSDIYDSERCWAEPEGEGHERAREW